MKLKKKLPVTIYKVTIKGPKKNILSIYFIVLKIKKKV